MDIQQVLIKGDLNIWEDLPKKERFELIALNFIITVYNRNEAVQKKNMNSWLHLNILTVAIDIDDFYDEEISHIEWLPLHKVLKIEQIASQ